MANVKRKDTCHRFSANWFKMLPLSFIVFSLNSIGTYIFATIISSSVKRQALRMPIFSQAKKRKKRSLLLTSLSTQTFFLQQLVFFK
jgi:hypothetical protein